MDGTRTLDSQAPPLIDDQHHITTPEGVPLTLALAGPVPRGIAYMIDLAFRAIVYLGGLLLAPWFGGFGWGVFLIVVFLLEWGYPVYFEVRRHGQTPGKKALGLAVVRDNATPVDFSGSLIRNLLRVADIFPIFYLAGLASMLLDNRFRRLGDLAAGTLVIHVHPQEAAHTSPEVHEPAFEDGPRAAPDWPVTLADRQLLLAYRERAPALTRARCDELAQLAFPALPPEEAGAHLDAVARELQGQPVTAPLRGDTA